MATEARLPNSLSTRHVGATTTTASEPAPIYTITKPIGEGTYGIVYKATGPQGITVAIKVLKPPKSPSKTHANITARRELDMLRLVKGRHPNIISLLDTFHNRDGQLCLVLEYAERSLLDEMVVQWDKHGTGLPPATVQMWMWQLLSALSFLHTECGVMHRDLKPENILIDMQGSIKLCDMGFARPVILGPTGPGPGNGGAPSSSSSTSWSSLSANDRDRDNGAKFTQYVATRWYRAPELLLGEARYGTPVDIWALGCLFVEMLTGQPLFPGQNDADQLDKITRCMSAHETSLKKHPTYPKLFLKAGGAGIHLVERALHPDSDNRATARQLMELPYFDDLRKKSTMMMNGSSLSADSVVVIKSDGSGGCSINLMNKKRKLVDNKDPAAASFETTKTRAAAAAAANVALLPFDIVAGPAATGLITPNKSSISSFKATLINSMTPSATSGSMDMEAVQLSEGGQQQLQTSVNQPTDNNSNTKRALYFSTNKKKAQQ